MNINFEASGTFEPDEPTSTAFLKHFYEVQRQSFDDDGGMHAVGAQMMLSYEEGQFGAEDLMMPCDGGRNETCRSR